MHSRLFLSLLAAAVFLPSRCLQAAENAAAAPALEPMKGLIWKIGRTGKDGPLIAATDIESVLDANPHIAGLLVHGHWNELEPAAGQCKWEMIDEAIGAARRKQRFYKLILMPGVHSPTWVYEAGAARFETLGSNPHRTATYKKPVALPLPWDPVYLRAFEEFIGAAGQRYAGDPLCKAVAITGANFQSAESHLPKSSKDEQQKWEELNYRENLPKAYERLIGMFARAFPRQQLCFHPGLFTHPFLLV